MRVTRHYNTTVDNIIVRMTGGKVRETSPHTERYVMAPGGDWWSVLAGCQHYCLCSGTIIEALSQYTGHSHSTSPGPISPILPGSYSNPSF